MNLKVTLFLLLLALTFSHVSIFAEEPDVSSPKYADIKNVSITLNDDVYKVLIEFYEDFPLKVDGELKAGVELYGRLYVDYDANASTGCNWPNEKGADYLAVFDLEKGNVLLWNGTAFVKAIDINVGYGKGVITLEIPSGYISEASKVKLWTKVTVSDETIRRAVRLSLAEGRYVELVPDMRENLPPWTDLRSIKVQYANGNKLYVALSFEGDAFLMINSSSFEALTEYMLFLDANGDRKVDYMLRSIRVLAKKPVVNLLIGGELYLWNESSKQWVLEDVYPGSLNGNTLVYTIFLPVKNLEKAVMIAQEPLRSSMIDFFPNGYFREEWYKG